MSKGYAGKVIVIDLSRQETSELATSDYANRFLGGRGLAAKLYWDLVPIGVKAYDPENCFICATGPVTGFFGLAGCRWVICSKTAAHQPEAFSYGNLGGKWGSALKYAGYDALVITGKAEKPCYLYIYDQKVEFQDADHLWGLSTFDTIEKVKAFTLKEASVLAIGPAAENLVSFATALAEGGASVSGGLGSIMGSKYLKAIAVNGNIRPVSADPDKLGQLVSYVKQIRLSTFNAPSPWAVPGLTRQENCFGCGVGCSRQSYKDETGRRYKNFCQATGIYSMPAMSYYGVPNDVPRLATRLCDGYGLDSAVMAPMIAWLIECYKQGLISEAQSGLPLSKAGNIEFLESLIHQISYRQGLGDILARGTLFAAEKIGIKAKELTSRFIAAGTNENKDYDPRLILTTAMLYATEPRKPITQLHGISGNTLISWSSWARGEKDAFLSTNDLRTIAARFWGSTQAADFSTYDGKALAAKKVQDRSCAQESLILCDVHWPMQITSATCPSGHVGDPSLESQVLSAVTGNNISEEELSLIGERIFNLQRAILLSQGWGGSTGDRILEYFFIDPLKKNEIFFNPEAVMPGPGGKLISRSGLTLDRDGFAQMKYEYYRLRGWDSNTGLLTMNTIKYLGLGDITNKLKRYNPVITS